MGLYLPPNRAVHAVNKQLTQGGNSNVRLCDYGAFFWPFELWTNFAIKKRGRYNKSLYLPPCTACFLLLILIISRTDLRRYNWFHLSVIRQNFFWTKPLVGVIASHRSSIILLKLRVLFITQTYLFFPTLQIDTPDTLFILRRGFPYRLLCPHFFSHGISGRHYIATLCCEYDSRYKSR